MNLVVVPEAGRFAERDILGVRVAVLDRMAAIRLIEARLIAGPFTRLAFLNAHCSNVAWRDGAYRAALGDFLVLADGVGVDLASQVLHGAAFPDNLNGTDFIPDLLRAIATPLRVGLLGARRDHVDAAAAALAHMAPQHDILVVADGYFTDADIPAIRDRIRSLRLDLLLVGMGVPRQELFIAGEVHDGHVRVAAGVGALFDFLSGVMPRAPDWMRRFRLEWLFRLWREPGRLWRRYLVGNPLFLARVLLRRFGRR